MLDNTWIMVKIKILLILPIILIFFTINFSTANNLFVWSLLGTQLEIGLNQRSYTSPLKHGGAGNALSTQQELVYRNKYDLISELDKAKTENERLKILNQYISYLSSAASNSLQIRDYEQGQVEYYKGLAKQCESPIKEKNKLFSDAVNNYDYEKAESIANEIAELRACVARNEVYAKAHASYTSSSNSSAKLKKKAEYLSENKDKIAKYYEILKPDLLKELYNISKTVEANF